MKCECGECSRCEFAARVAKANGSATPKKAPKLKSLVCIKCDKTMELRSGQGRQRSLCADCFKENRRENGKKQDAKRREQRRSAKE